ncbi:N-6 DNA methylase [Paenibacillus alkaliterrae]|uniref:class I SAM-dependent DNA methyltransferase n=1 Tax=Paenibacillus alkaliterrae TaxID=320909 RepID=UPI001F2D573D|nr:DNA methyltransferase [Paenibacillus alkaliterrae]MCF2941035.1 N-6 DNA methylase [Paenibacillus alkaliterrae]
MNIAEIENNVQNIIKTFNNDTFIFDLLLAYGNPKASITRLQKGNLNLSKKEGEIAWKKKLLFKETSSDIDLHDTIDSLRNVPKALTHDPRFIIVTDYKTILAVDTKTGDTLDIEIKNIGKRFDFFLPWAGLEKAQLQIENPADVKAAERMAKLYDEIKKDNPTKTETEVHSLNVFLARLLFCFFAEDTGIFEEGLFTKSIASHTQTDGSDLNRYLDNLFNFLDTNEKERINLPTYLEEFPYVNGGLFNDKHKELIFTKRSRQAIIESGELDWSAINPDIFGSMIQAVIKPEYRSSLGMHYTSVPNILKVIKPLFLDELYEDFYSSYESETKLKNIHVRLTKMKIFDPACGSGNFLIIAYKELRKLEMEIFKRLNNISKQQNIYFPEISLSQFYGIEIDDFAHEIAILSLWLAEHQMNVEFYKEFGRTKPTLPLQNSGNIFRGNATRLNWEEFCPKEKETEVFILGNPPYLGFNERGKEQKNDMDFALGKINGIQRLDYIGCWFVKASDYIKQSTAKYAFVSTNSISQGEQVSLLWPYVFSNGLEIFFAYQSFKWTNNAKGKAAVICVIVGVQNKCDTLKKIFSSDSIKTVKNINPYLFEGDSIVMHQRTSPISSFPEMILGSSGIDGGNLMLSPIDKEKLTAESINSAKFIKPFIGGKDFLSGIERYCLWIDDSDLSDALKIQGISDRIESCRKYRETAGRDARKAASVPHRFFYRKYKNEDAIILPMTSSERREYLTVGFYEGNTVFSNGVFVIYGAEAYMFGILSSKMHMVWANITSGRLKSDLRYSVNLTYNTFPFPKISNNQKNEINNALFSVLEEREKHSEKTIATLYDPEKMPEGLSQAHKQLDFVVERCYRSKPFESDEERLEYLFELYEQMTSVEKRK